MFCSNLNAKIYATATQATALLLSGVQYRRDRMEAADMITTDEAAELAGTNRVTINAWIRSGRCVAVSNCVAASSCRAGSSSPDSLPGQGGSANWEIAFNAH